MMDPWERFQARKAADKVTMMHGKLRESTSWIDQLNLDPWEKFQALRAADKFTATRRQSTRGTNQLRSDILRQIEREDVRVTPTPSESLTTPFVCSRRPVGTPDHVTSLGYNGVYQPRTMQTESRGLSSLYYSGNFARETGLHTLQQQRLHGSTGPFSDVEDWFASKYMRAPKQEHSKSSAKQRTSTRDILGVYPSSYGAQDFTDRSSTGTDTESIGADSTDDTSSDVSEISCGFNSSDLDQLFEDSGDTVNNWNNHVEPQNSTTVQQLYSMTLPISGGNMGKPQSRNVTVSHSLSQKQDNPCVKICTDDSTAFTVTDTVTDESVKSAEQQKTSTEGDVNVHPSSPEVQNNIDDLFTLTEPMPARATDDTSSFVPRLIYPLDSSGLEEMSDDCDSIITEAVDIPRSEIEESFTIDKTLNVEDCNESETREGASNFGHQVGEDNPEIIHNCAFKEDVKPTEQESMESNVSPPIPLTEDRLKEIPALASDSKPEKIEPETLINEKKTTEQVVSTPETPEPKGDTASRDKSTQTEQDHLQQRQVKEEVTPEAVTKLTCGSDETAFPETSSEDIKKICIRYSRYVLSQGERGQDKAIEPQQASAERSTVCEISELRCSEINGQSDRHTDRSNLEILDKVEQDIKDTGSNMNLEKIQTTDDQDVTEKGNKNKPKEEERVKINTMEIEDAPKKKQMELTNERIDNNLDELREKVEEQITADQKLNDTESKNKHEKEERVKRNILETEEALRQEDKGLGYKRIEKYLAEFKKKLEEQYVGSRPDTSFVRGGDINVTVQCGVMNTKHVLPPTGNQPVPDENPTSAYRKDGHENDPKGVCPQTGPWVDKRAKRQTRHIKKCRNCGSTRLDTVSASSGLILGTSVSQRSPRFLIDSMQGDPSAYCKERGRERTAHSPMSEEQSIVLDKTRASNTTRIGGQRESQQRKSRSQKLRYGEVDPCATDPDKKKPSRKANNECVLCSPTTSQSPLSPPKETKETDEKPERKKRKRNVLKRKKSEDKYKVGSENEPGSAQSQKETIKPSHSKTVKPKDDFTNIFVTETAKYQCPSSDEANETSSRPKDSTIEEASSLISTGSINSDTNDKSGRKNVNATETKLEASPKAHREKSSSTSGESDDSTDNVHKSKRKIVGKSGTRLKRSIEPTKFTKASPKTHRDKSSSTSSEFDDSTDSDSISKRKRTGKYKSRLKRLTGHTKTRKPEASPKTHKDRSSSTSSDSDDSTNRIKTSEVKKERETGSKKDVKSKRKSRNLPPVTSTSTAELTGQSIGEQEFKQTTRDSEPSAISSNITKSSESTDEDTIASSHSTTDINSDSETEDNDDDEKEDKEQTNADKIKKKEKRKKEIAELKKKLEKVKKIDKSEKRSQENQKKEQKTVEKLDKELDKRRKEIEKVNLKREQQQIKNEKDEEKNALKEEKKLQKMQMKQEKEEQSKIKKKAKKAESEEKKLEKLRNEIKKVEDKHTYKNTKMKRSKTDDDDEDEDDDECGHGGNIVNAINDDFVDIVEGDGEVDNKGTKVDTINLNEKRKNEIAELKKKLEEVKKVDKSEKRSQENQKKEQKTMEKLDKELEKKRKEIEKVNLKREQQQIKKEKDEKKNALKEEKKLQKMQTKEEKEEQSKIKKEAKKAESEEKKLEKLRNEIKKVEDKQASKKIEQNHTDVNDDDDDDNDDDDRGYVGNHIVNDTVSDSDEFVEGDDEDESKKTERGEMDGKVDVKNKIAELKEKLEEGKRIEKAEKRSRESQKKDEQAKKRSDKKQEQEKKKLEEVARKKEQQRIKDERNKNVKLLQEKKKFLEKQIKQKKKEQAKIQKEAKKAAKDAEKEIKKSHKTQKDVQKKEQKKALNEEEKHSNEKDDEDDFYPKVNDCHSDYNDDEGSDDENKQTKSETMVEHADFIQNEIAELKEELEEVKMTEETQKRQIKSDEKNEQAIEKLDKEMEREKKKMEEIDRKLELKQKKIEKDEEKKMLKEEKTIFEKLMKEEKKEQSRITKAAKKAEKEKEKERKKAEKEEEKERKKAEQEKEKQRKKVEKEQKDAQKKEEKEAKKAAEKEQKEAEKVVKKREKEQKEKEKREKTCKKKEQQKEKKREKEKQKEESKLLAFRRKKEMERQSRMKKAEEQKEKEEMKRKAAEKEAAQKEEINKIKKERKREKERWKVIEKRDKINLKNEKEDRKIEQKHREHEQILLKIRNGLKHGNQSLAEDSQDEITKDESSPDTSSSDSEQEITKKRPLSNKPLPVIPAEDCENEYMEIFQNCASNESDKPCDRFAPDSFGHLTVRDHDDIDDYAVRSRKYQMKEKKINLVVEFQKYLARKARSRESEEASNSVSNQAPSGNSETNERGLSLPFCTESQNIIEAEEISEVHQNRQTSEQLEEQKLPSQEKGSNEDSSKSTRNASRKLDVVQPAGAKDWGKGAHTGSSENPRTPKVVQSVASGEKSDKKAANPAGSPNNLGLFKSTRKVTRTPGAAQSVVNGKVGQDILNTTGKAMNYETGSGYHSWDDSDDETEIEKKTSVMNLDQRRGIEKEFVPDGGHNSWDDTDEETEVEKKPSIMKLNEMKGIDVEFVPEYSYNSWDDTDDEDTIEHEIKDVMGENLDIYEPKPTPPVEKKEPDILADPILKELYGDLYEEVFGIKENK